MTNNSQYLKGFDRVVYRPSKIEEWCTACEKKKEHNFVSYDDKENRSYYTCNSCGKVIAR